MIKRLLFFGFGLLLGCVLFLQNSVAQDYTQFSLPEGAIARLGKGKVFRLQYSPDGTRLAVASSIGIWLYDTATHQEVALLTGHTGGVQSVLCSVPGWTHTRSGSSDGTIRLWDATTGREKATLTGHTSAVKSLAFSPDGGTLASGSVQEVRLWDAVTGTHKKTLTEHTFESRVSRSARMGVH